MLKDIHKKQMLGILRHEKLTATEYWGQKMYKRVGCRTRTVQWVSQSKCFVTDNYYMKYSCITNGSKMRKMIPHSPQ